MADRFPLILNTSANQIQEIASGDQLDLSGNNIANAGIITASSFSGPVVASGIITAVAADIDDFVDVGSNIQLGNAGVITATTFKGDGDFVELDVDGHTNLDNVSVAGVTTVGGQFTVSANNNGANVRFINDTHNQKFYLISEGTSKNSQIFFGDADDDDIGSIDYDHANNSLLFVTNTSTRMTIDGGGKVNIGGDIDVDGHTNLDNVSVSGVSTFAGNADFSAGIDVTGTITGTSHVDLPDAAEIKLGDNDEFLIYHTATGTSYIKETGSGDLYIDATNIRLRSQNGNEKLATTSTGVSMTGNATVSGNLSVGGVLTYEDVVNVDSVGIVTARSGVFIPDNNELKIGNTAGSPDTKIFHNGSKTRLVSTVQYDMDADTIDIHNASANSMKARFLNNQVELYYANNKKFETTNTGISVTGRADISTGLAVGTSGVQASNVVSIKGAVSNQLNIADSSNNSWGLLLTQSQASGGYHATTNSGVGKPCAIVNVNADALHFGTSNTLRWTIDNTGHFLSLIHI